ASNSNQAAGAISSSPTTAAIDSPTTSAIHINDKVRDVVTCSQAAKSSEQVTAQLESAVAAAAASVEAAGSSGGLSNSSSVASLETSADGTTDAAMAPAPKKPNRCQVCKKRVGLTGFVCRCGGLYCGEHRYDSAHGCSFDYKTMEREELRKNNPVIVSEKIQRI
ncbi:unnamed protein product, partial [Anisakis simplex]|uniref:Zinc finger protein, putative (inferred by orthology to a S. mansoni protein) n=1 Tax=Anisakis simplex TaxID=6269 RepID=A0A0M3K7M0_ANISI